ncbi:MAG: hypothetical protein OXC62_12340 [Aestuariivita sp.]|nr:hypothetical protein [Aestuariivita sp.]
MSGSKTAPGAGVAKGTALSSLVWGVLLIAGEWIRQPNFSAQSPHDSIWP